MGNTENWVTADSSFPTEQQLLANLIPIDDGEISNEMLALGRFKIYRFNAEPYEIVIKHVRIFTPNNPRFPQYEQAARKTAARIDHKNIAKIHSVNICKRSNICMQQISIQSYVNYYAIDLESVIQQRRMNDNRFTTGELWYMLNSLVDLAFYLKSLQINFGIYTARNICVSPEGYLKVYLFHCTPTNQHFLYYHLISNDSRDIHKYLPLPPECLPMLRKQVRTLSDVDYQKMDVFGIGMVALEAMLYNPTRRYYLHQGQSQITLKFDEKQLYADFRQLREVYPESLINLVQKMTKIDTCARLNLSEIKDYIKDIRESISINGSIRMINNQQPSSNIKISYKSTAKEESTRGILRNITCNGEKKLQFLPLKAISKQKSTTSASQYNSLNMSLAVHSRKQNKLMMSNATVAHPVGRKRDMRLQGRLQSSLR